MDLINKIVGISFGIRYSRSFRIPDISGDIIDEILYGEDTPFGSNLYQKVSEPPNREKILSNTETEEYLRINTDDVILGIKVREDFDRKYRWLVTEVIPYLEKIFTAYKVRNILRVGVIFHHRLPKNEKLKDMVQEITAKSVGTTENIDVRFTKKLSTFQGILKKGVSDYRNTIYILSESRNYLLANIDYQHYFEPMVEDLRECKVKNIVEEAKEFMIKNYHPWISKYAKRS